MCKCKGSQTSSSHWHRHRGSNYFIMNPHSTCKLDGKPTIQNHTAQGTTHFMWISNCRCKYADGGERHHTYRYLYITQFQTNQYHLPLQQYILWFYLVLKRLPKYARHIFMWWLAFRQFCVACATFVVLKMLSLCEWCTHFSQPLHGKLRNRWNDCLIDMKSTISLVLFACVLACLCAEWCAYALYVLILIRKSQ